ncbi:uncharacterized protein Z520_01863 [Fonsecaea multimorphosa CBS 102226]|uniref:G-protein coupled receptors family 1 profile domain-containing protein n=1 Tax=Fonsecaea multimorphosa CBS 102226 TaxID=1442371 RepID=A0A0D2KEE9_9EURO|nr:uncharacterized protein Z520_01863 [Fonsecaea multimorphosa CBS 102226]KIY01725.1 hypothetical protein Z520_01863 [Fonsecaea multimorphosa CBS 102226]OAL29921.1 hypothetical protein AYO22_01827 [Fonsecaea multimorphosa]
MTSSKIPQGPPYAPQTVNVGGIPTVDVDVPICSVFMFLFLVGAICHMTILQINLRRGHKFLMSGILFGFCMAREVALTIRTVWAVYPNDTQIAIAAAIFVPIGVLLLFLVNLIFAQRILRASHPHIGWNKAVSTAFKILYALIVVMLAIIISATVDNFFVLKTDAHNTIRDLTITAVTYFLFLSFLPIPIVILAVIIPRKTRVEKFGKGRWRTKIAVLLTSSVLLCLGSSFRAATAYKTPRPKNNPAWFDKKWCFYFFNFTLETIVIYLYLLLRVDRRFHIPNGSKGPGDYSAGQRSQEKPQEVGDSGGGSSVATRVNSEEEVFDDHVPIEREPGKAKGSPV